MVKKKFDCKSCDEDGYTTTWESDKKTDEYASPPTTKVMGIRSEGVL